MNTFSIKINSLNDFRFRQKISLFSLSKVLIDNTIGLWVPPIKESYVKTGLRDLEPELLPPLSLEYIDTKREIL